MLPERTFLIVSNMRCGSTLTQFMLGELSDVSTDFEVKWKPTYAPHPIHLVIDEETGSLKAKLLASISPSRIVGSKLVFDPVSLSAAEQRHILSMVDNDMRIIHIKRPYWQVVASSLRGFIHMPTQDADASQSQAYQILNDAKEQTAARSHYTIRRSDVKKEDVLRLLKILLANDLCALKLCRRDSYLRLPYKRLAKSLPRMVRHIGSHETKARILAITEHPPLEKLPPLHYEGDFVRLKILAFWYDVLFFFLTFRRI